MASVAFITTNDYGFGGSEDLWIGAAASLVAAGHRVAVSVKEWNPPPVPLQHLAGIGCTILSRACPPRPEDFRAVTDFDPDLVIFSHGYHMEGWDWLQRARQAQVPYVCIIHCVHEAGWPSLDEPAIQHMHTLHRNAAALCFVSDGNRRLYERITGYRCEHALIVRNPFKVRADLPFSWPDADVLRLATVGRLECFHKGYDLLMAALASRRWSGRAAELNMYGDGPHRALLQRLGANAQIPVTFHGHVRDVEEVWRHNHALIQPSRLEGLPLSVVEALLCGRPVVATDVGGNAEVIEPGVSGFIASAATVADVAGALEKLWERRSDLPGMGQVAHTAIRRLVPRDPCAAFANLILTEGWSKLAPPPHLRAGIRISPLAVGGAEDHLIVLYYHPQGHFSEDRRLADFVLAGVWSHVRFRGVGGRVRLDPCCRPASIEIRNLRINGADHPVTIQSAGTAEAISSNAHGFEVLSIGADPQLLIGEESFPEGTTIEFEIRLS